MTDEQAQKLLGKQIVAVHYENESGDETLRITFDDHSHLYFYVNYCEGDLIFTNPEK